MDSSDAQNLKRWNNRQRKNRSNAVKRLKKNAKALSKENKYGHEFEVLLVILHKKDGAYMSAHAYGNGPMLQNLSAVVPDDLTKQLEIECGCLGDMPPGNSEGMTRLTVPPGGQITRLTVPPGGQIFTDHMANMDDTQDSLDADSDHSDSLDEGIHWVPEWERNSRPDNIVESRNSGVQSTVDNKTIAVDCKYEPVDSLNQAEEQSNKEDTTEKHDNSDIARNMQRSTMLRGLSSVIKYNGKKRAIEHIENEEKKEERQWKFHKEYSDIKYEVDSDTKDCDPNPPVNFDPSVIHQSPEIKVTPCLQPP